MDNTPDMPTDKRVMPLDEEKDLLSVAYKHYTRGYEHDRENLDNALIDAKFVTDESQWRDEDKADREGRPCLTIDKTTQYVRQITGNIRQLRPSMKCVPVDSRGDPETAQIIGDHFRYIENRSNARNAYTKAADQQVISGIGHWRVKSEYSHQVTFNQELGIEYIKGQVIWDPDAESPTRDDAMYCLVLLDMNRDAFEEKYPEYATDGDFEGAQADNSEDLDWDGWETDDFIRLAEYWCKKPITRTLLVMPDGSIDDLTDDKGDNEKVEIGLSQGGTIQERPGFRVMRYLITSRSVIEADEWDGRYIPIIPCIGEEIDVGRRTTRRGIVRRMIDVQRRYNYFVSAETEIVAGQSKAPWLGTELNFSKDPDWKVANTKILPYMTYVPDDKTGGAAPQRVAPPLSSQGLGEGIALADADMDAVTGQYPATRGQQSNETSGIAIRARESQGDTGSFVFIDNFNMAIAHTGRVVLDLIPHVYDTQRTISIIAEDGEQDIENINQTVIDPKAEEYGRKLNDVTVAAYDVVMSNGPSYQTRRMESRESMIAFAQAMPEHAAAFPDMIAKAQDWVGADEIATRLKRGIDPQILDDPDDQDEQQPPAEPPPEVLAAQAQAQLEQMKMQSKQAELEMDGEARKIDLQTKREEAELRLEVQRQELALKIRTQELMLEKQQIDLEVARRKSQMDLVNHQAKVTTDISIRDAQGQDTTAELYAQQQLNEIEGSLENEAAVIP